jgi:hypothetical protein
MRHSFRVVGLLTLVSIAALAALTLFGCGTRQSVSTAPTDRSSATAGVTALKQAVATAITAQNRATPALMRAAGVIGTGASADEAGRPVIVVYAERAGVTGIPAEIEGVATRTVITGPVMAYARPGGGTLQMGTSTGNDNECASGTLGCVVVKGGVDYFLSNNHVFARENAATIGERIDAPGRYDGKPRCAQTAQCANLSQFVAVSFSGNNTMDAAIARPIGTRPYTQVEAGGYDPSSTVVAPSVGLAVKKTGRTSGLTHGTIQAINVTIQVQYSTGQIATFVNQIQTPGTFIRSGDSGSLMVTESDANPVGLCFAGGSGASFANPIGPVLSAFNATVK